jgi:hypothetical protein
VASGNTEWKSEGIKQLTGISRIPIVISYANRIGYLDSSPPLLDLAHENIRHYQIRSDRDNSLHIAGTPVPVFIGVDNPDRQIGLGADLAVKLPTGGDAKYLEPTGAALNSSRDELNEIEKRMANLGLAMLQSEIRGAETAEAKRIDKSEGDATLSTAARNHENAIAEALELHVEWMDIAESGRVEINKDFESGTMDVTLINALSSMVERNQLSLDTMWDILEQGEILPDTFDPEDEKAKLADAIVALMSRMRAAAPPGGEEEEGEEENETGGGGGLFGKGA